MKYEVNYITALYVEDDPNLAFVTKDNLERRGITIIHCKDGESAYNTFLSRNFHLCIIDIMLPRMDGLSLIRRIRKINQNVPILILSAKSLLEDRLEGFKSGADDYLMKPYSIDELLYKVDIFLKRSNVTFIPRKEDTRFSCKLGKYDFDFNELTLKSNASTVSLTLREAELLRLLCENKNHVVPRGVIIEKVWNTGETYTGRSIDVFISKLRKHLAQDSNIQIESVRSFGYKLSIS